MCVCVCVCTSTLSVDNFHTFEPNSQSVCVCISTLSVNNLHTFEPNYWGAGGRVGGGGGMAGQFWQVETLKAKMLYSRQQAG